MGTINYTLISGALPITVSLVGSALPDNVHYSFGDYSFTDVPDGSYYIHVVDSQSCVSNYPSTGYLTLCETCEAGWTAVIGGCELLDIVDPTAPTDPKLLAKKTSVAYTNFGVVITGDNWYLDGTADTYTLYHALADNFWGNHSANTTNGILNKCGLWSETTLNNQEVGFSKCFDILVEKVYYIGIGCDNYAYVTLDGTTIIQQDQVALNIWLNRTQGDAICHKYWYIYPITLTAGSHIIEVIGHNNASVAALGVEIYDIEPSLLMTYNSYAEMGAGLIFSSKDMVGQAVQIGDNGQGYECPNGYSLDCGTPPKCVKRYYYNCGETPPITTTTTTLPI